MWASIENARLFNKNNTGLKTKSGIKKDNGNSNGKRSKPTTASKIFATMLGIGFDKEYPMRPTPRKKSTTA